MSKAFDAWKSSLITSAGGVCLASAVTNLGDPVLECFRREGCEPTIAALMEYAIAGLSKKYDIRASNRESLPNDTARR
jgi:hypothetical protein